MSLGDQHLEFGDVFSDLREEEYLTHMDDTNLFEDINLDNIDVLPPSPQPVDGLSMDHQGKSSNKANCSSNVSERQAFIWQGIERERETRVVGIGRKRRIKEKTRRLMNCSSFVDTKSPAYFFFFEIQ